MRVRDLIEKLQAFDPDLPVVRAGFDEHGIDGIRTVRRTKIVRLRPPGAAGWPEFKEAGHTYPSVPERIDEPVDAVFVDL